jgi:hypothetical protein
MFGMMEAAQERFMIVAVVILLLLLRILLGVLPDQTVLVEMVYKAELPMVAAEVPTEEETGQVPPGVQID